MLQKKSHSGFSLIEILVVISIIGILAAILIFNFQEARMGARDKARKADLQSLQLALELYKTQNGRYPAQGCGVTFPQWAGSESSYSGHPSVTPCVDNYISGLVPEYLPQLPSEVSSEKSAKGYAYIVAADGSSYKVITHHSIESEFITGYQDEYARYPKSTCVSPYPEAEKDVYSVYSFGGAECW